MQNTVVVEQQRQRQQQHHESTDLVERKGEQMGILSHGVAKDEAGKKDCASSRREKQATSKVLKVFPT